MADQGDKDTERILKEKMDEIRAQAGQDMEIRIDEAPYAPKFQEWIDDYEHDVALFKDILRDEDTPAPLRRLVAGGLMYLIRKFDLIPDYLKPVGLLDDAIVLRVTADLGAEHTAELNPRFMKQMFKLANDAEVVKAFFGDGYRDLENYVRKQPDEAVHGITGASVVEHASSRDELLTQVNEEMKSFEANAITDGAKVERELKSYIHAKLDAKK
jgi:uncharacterized membrane protein YkvA (DUF1232 family)